jgi:hypothetical protein
MSRIPFRGPAMPGLVNPEERRPIAAVCRARSFGNPAHCVGREWEQHPRVASPRATRGWVSAMRTATSGTTCPFTAPRGEVVAKCSGGCKVVPVAAAGHLLVTMNCSAPFLRPTSASDGRPYSPTESTLCYESVKTTPKGRRANAPQSSRCAPELGVAVKFGHLPLMLDWSEWSLSGSRQEQVARHFLFPQPPFTYRPERKLRRHRFRV